MCSARLRIPFLALCLLLFACGEAVDPERGSESEGAAPQEISKPDAGSVRNAWRAYQDAFVDRSPQGLWEILADGPREEINEKIEDYRNNWKQKDSEEIDPEFKRTCGELLGLDDMALLSLFLSEPLAGESLASDASGWVFLEETAKGDRSEVSFRDQEQTRYLMKFRKVDGAWRVSDFHHSFGKRSDADTASEARALSGLMAISTGQEQFKNAMASDENGNGVGEYGFLAELGGRANVRGPEGPRYEECPFIPPFLGKVDAGGVSVHEGYCFIIYLPAGPSRATATKAELVAHDLAELKFVAFAWPKEYGTTGRPAFMMDASGQPQKMEDSRWSGPAQIPPWNAAFEAGESTWESSVDESAWKQVG